MKKMNYEIDLDNWSIIKFGFLFAIGFRAYNFLMDLGNVLLGALLN